MNESEIILLFKTYFFEWKQFSPLQKTLENYISQTKALNTDTEDEEFDKFQSKLVKETICSNIIREYPPCLNSTVSFIKRLILVLEEYDIEGHSSFYDYISPLSNSSTEPAKYHYKSYFDNYGKHLVSLVEKRELICDGTTGLRTWQAGKFLSNWLLENSQHFPKQKEFTILELGSGVGFTGISLSKDVRCASSRMILTDHHSKVLRTLYQNVKANLFDRTETSRNEVENNELVDQVDFPVEFTSNTGKLKRIIIDILDWETFSQDENGQRFACDMIIGADIVYDTSVIPHLVNVLVKFLKHLGTEKVILANCVRNEDTDDLFMKTLEQSNISFTKENYTVEDGSPLNLYIMQKFKAQEIQHNSAN